MIKFSLYVFFIIKYACKFLASFNIKALKNRQNIENYFFDNLQGKSFYYIFHVSSVGEFEQSIPIIIECSKKDSVLIVFSSLSVKENIINFVDCHNNVSCLIYPFIGIENTKTLINIINSAKKIFIVRYDFFPEFFINNNYMVLLEGSLKTVLNSQLKKYVFLDFFNKFDYILTSSPTEIDSFNNYLSDPNSCIIKSFELRSIQINNRINNINSVLQQIDFILPLLDLFSKDNRLIIANSWDKDMLILNNSTLLDKIKRMKLFVMISPHNLSGDSLRNLNEKLFNICYNKIPIYTINNNDSSFDIESFKREPGVVVNLIPKVLLELYSFFSVAYVGGGFNRSIHSVLEPYYNNCNIICGPKIFRSTEFDSISKSNSIKSISEQKYFYKEYLKYNKDFKYKDNITNIYKEFDIIKNDLVREINE